MTSSTARRSPQESLRQSGSDFSEVILGHRSRAAGPAQSERPEPALDEAVRKVTGPRRRAWSRTTAGSTGCSPMAWMSSTGARTARSPETRSGCSTSRDPERQRLAGVNQFTVIEDKHNRRPDVVVFVNGLPLAVMELKNPGDENATVKGAFNQLQTYKKDIPGLFHFNELLVISDGLDARVGTLTADWERFMPWRTIDGVRRRPASTPRNWKCCSKGSSSRSGSSTSSATSSSSRMDGPTRSKKLAGYHQYHAVNKAVDCTVGPPRPRVTSGSASSGTPRAAARA